jgi:hypothetical protein
LLQPIKDIKDLSITESKKEVFDDKSTMVEIKQQLFAQELQDTISSMEDALLSPV